MAISKKIEGYLKKAGIKYDVVKHKKVYTAHDLAATLKKQLNAVAKSLLIKADKKYVIVSIPAGYQLDLGKLKKQLKAKALRIANEPEIKKVLKMKLGMLTPFANLHKLELVIDKALLKVKDVLANAGSFTDSVRLKMKDLHRLENARVAHFAKKAVKKVKKASKKKWQKSKNFFVIPAESGDPEYINNGFPRVREWQWVWPHGK